MSMQESVTEQDRFTLIWLALDFAQSMTAAKAARIRAEIASALDEWKLAQLKKLRGAKRKEYASAEPWRLLNHPRVTTNMDLALYLYDEKFPKLSDYNRSPVHVAFRNGGGYRKVATALIMDARDGPIAPLVRATTWLSWHDHREAWTKVERWMEWCDQSRKTFHDYLDAEQQKKKGKGNRSEAAQKNRATKAQNRTARLAWYRETVEAHRSFAPGTSREQTIAYVAPLAKARFDHTESVVSRYISELHLFGKPKTRSIGPYGPTI